MASETPPPPTGLRSLVIGANGQDGSYLAEHLLRCGCRVVGLGRQAQSRFIPGTTPGYTYVPVDLSRDRETLPDLLVRSRPDRIYHFAAVHGASGFAYEEHGQDALQVNIGSVHQVLEYIRTTNPEACLLYASSVKAFNAKPAGRVHEELPRHSTCLYSITKNAATDLIGYYRHHHNVRATTLFLANHESPRRPSHYVLPRITQMLAAALSGEQPSDPLRSLNFSCDWGSSAEFVELGTRLLEVSPNQDYVMATGRTWTGFELVRELFSLAERDWQNHLPVLEPIDTSYAATFGADISRMVSVLGYGPQKNALDVALWILAENHGLHLRRHPARRVSTK
ncbi:putative GDP-mannose 4,6-dehydratase [Candidatus Filomicrobium marinum]|uniref:GDP-mannose 4,6-dehydratase n=1 Tax=Candidatus Filomicrobium marinum TaxID=1608628 RepID=A0A0D6JJR9_9HYPH|nr:GDP-mannose 4,6-dehydratase [Candidatus Filomicrobium marinum]CFX56035.1 putative GDP-mannose 4,6-dehydratase [Candidatus Filomicrobium marinum]CPR22218.1 putative GDP-mannose 4,6-dehydratase [Candidatus Filomicrobium marinum]